MEIKICFSKLISTRGEIDSQCPNLTLLCFGTRVHHTAELVSCGNQVQCHLPLLLPIFSPLLSSALELSVQGLQCSVHLTQHHQPLRSLSILMCMLSCHEVNTARFSCYWELESNRIGPAIQKLLWMYCMMLRSSENTASVVHTDDREAKNIKYIYGGRRSSTTLCFPNTAQLQRKMRVGSMC